MWSSPLARSLTRQEVADVPWGFPPGKTIIHATNNPGDINKDYSSGYPIIGEDKLVLRQCIEAAQGLLGGKARESGRRCEAKSGQRQRTSLDRKTWDAEADLYRERQISPLSRDPEELMQDGRSV